MEITLGEIRTAIIRGPIVFCHRGPGEQLFQHDRVTGCILLAEDLWQELSLKGPAIREAAILRWVESTSGLSGQAIEKREILDLLTRRASPEKLSYSNVPEQRKKTTANRKEKPTEAKKKQEGNYD